MSALTPQIVLQAYARGIFPMAEHQDDPTVYWIDPESRGLLPLDAFHVPRRLLRTVRGDLFEVRVDSAFAEVVAGCASRGPGRWTTWINDQIVELYCALHDMERAHSVECWRDGELVGGLYGVSLAGAFFGESMFSRASDASKVALVHLVARLKRGGYRLLDTQFVTQHLATFGAIEVSRREYLRLLERALEVKGDFYSLPEGLGGAEILQSITQTS
jgi:leucyl/phenylalanyl-tRNA--protein transferase